MARGLALVTDGPGLVVVIKAGVGVRVGAGLACCKLGEGLILALAAGLGFTTKVNVGSGLGMGGLEVNSSESFRTLRLASKASFWIGISAGPSPMGFLFSTTKSQPITVPKTITIKISCMS